MAKSLRPHEDSGHQAPAPYGTSQSTPRRKLRAAAHVSEKVPCVTDFSYKFRNGLRAPHRRVPHLPRRSLDSEEVEITPVTAGGGPGC